MPSFTEIASRLYRQLLGIKPPGGDVDGITTLLEGSVAVAAVETILSEASTSGERYPTEVGAVAWRGEQQRQQFNLFGQPLLQIENESPRAALSSAMGLVLSGKRAHCPLWASDLVAAQDLLRRAVGLHLPLVIHTVLRGEPLQGEGLGGSHQPLHALRDSGAIILLACNGQEVVDMTLIAHAVAEQVLLPVIVAMEGEETAFSMQRLQLPSPQLLEKMVGDSRESITVEDSAQQMLFGTTRQRIPCWHDLDRPVLNAPYLDRYSAALGELSHTTFFSNNVSKVIEQTFERFQQLTERSYTSVRHHGSPKSRRFTVALGAVSERLQPIIDHLQQQERSDLSLLTIQVLAPLPTRSLRKWLRRADEVTVFDQAEPPLGDPPPLFQQILSFTSPSCRTHSIIGGHLGVPLRDRDLLAACKLPVSAPTHPLRLGIDTLPRQDNPKQQVQHDLLLRHYPDLKQLGLQGAERYSSLSKGAVTIAVIHQNQAHQRALLTGLVQQLDQTADGSVRSYRQENWSTWGESQTEWLSWCEQPISATIDPEQPIDFALVTGLRPQQQIPSLSRMHDGTILLIDPGPAGAAVFLQQMPPEQTTALHQTGATIYFASYRDESCESTAIANAQIVGNLFSLINQRGSIPLRESRLVSAYHPEQQREDFQQALLEPLNPYPLQRPAERSALPPQTPMAVRHLGSSENTTEGYQHLSRFWDQTGVLYRDGMQSRQGIDPFLAGAKVPPLSSTFTNHSQRTSRLPRFSPADCSGCGACWSFCPDSAIGATALTPTQLLEAGLKMGGANALRPHLSKLAKVLGTLTTNGSSSELIRQGWSALMEQAPLAEDRRATADEAIDQLCNNLKDLPVAHTERLFHERERQKPLAGELLTIVVNPDSCKSCGLCTTLCAQEAERLDQAQPALTLELSTAETLQQDYQQWRCWEQLPDTASTTLIDFAARPEIGSLRATLLSRYASMAIGGGDLAEPGAGDKLIIRQLLGITEYRQQPLVRQQLETLESLYQKLMAGIEEQLAAASHIDDLKSLSEGLSELTNRNLTLKTLAEKTADIDSEGVDAYLLREWIELAEMVQQEIELISTGEQSLGRARYSLIFASGNTASWAGAFPLNPFQVPVTITDAAEAGALASGVIEGQLERATRTHRLIRQANSLLKSGPLAERKALQQLTWRDLTADERQQTSPLLLIGNDTTLGAAASGGLSWLLNSDLPIKVIVLAELDLGFAGESGLHGTTHHHCDARSELALVALAQRNAYVAQCSIANTEQLNQSMREALHYHGPALLRIHAPSPLRHGFASDQTLQQAVHAVNSRAFPLFRYNPEHAGVFGTRISLEGNPPNATPIADWAIRETRFASLFSLLTSEDKSPTALEQWHTLDSRAQGNKTPTCDYQFDTLKLEPSFARRLGQLLDQWQLLQELAGAVTPFTERIEEEAAAAVAGIHRQEIEALKQQHQQELQALRGQLESEVTERITGRLSSLVEHSVNR